MTVESLMDTAFAIVVPVAMVSWVIAVYSMFAAIFCLKPGVDLWKDAPLRNPFNHILVASHLSDTGLKHRRRLIICAILFVVPILLVIGLGTLLGQPFNH